MSKLFILCFLLLTVHWAKAQQKDSARTMEEFMEVCNAYKSQVPLHLKIGYRSTSNLVTNQEDTASFDAEFYLLKQGSYMNFGEVEEIVNDSMALLVSRKMKRMMLYTHAEAVIAQLKASMGVKVPKSSVEQWCKKFEVFKDTKENKARIELVGRSRLRGTNVAAETIEMICDPSGKMPAEVTNIKRSMVPVDQAAYEDYLKNADSDKVVHMENGYFLVKEQKMVFAYKEFDHAVLPALPVTMSERIARSEGNGKGYEPQKGYEGYVLSEE